MHAGKLVFAQLMEHLPLRTFRQCVARYASSSSTEPLRAQSRHRYGLPSQFMSWSPS